jgi:hypothetical protein
MVVSDWHSSVHGHWMLIRLLKLYPQMNEASLIRSTLSKTLTQENILNEVKIFQSTAHIILGAYLWLGMDFKTG